MSDGVNDLAFESTVSQNYGDNEKLVINYQLYKKPHKKRQVLQELVEKNQSLISWRVRVLLRSQLQIENPLPELFDACFQEGSIGFIKAVERFKPEMGYKFVTYAVPYIDREVRRAIPKEVEVVYYPIWVSEFSSKTDRLDSCLTPTKLAKNLHDYIKPRDRYLSIQPRKSQDDTKREPVLDESHMDSFNHESYGELYTLSKSVIEALRLHCTEREQKVLLDYYSGNSTLSEISKELSLSQERVNQIRWAAIASLQDNGQFTLNEIAAGIGFGSIVI